MARLCVRTGCDHVADAQLSYDPVNCHAWLDMLAAQPGQAQELCQRHAANLTVPQGWTCEDRRSSLVADFAAEVPAPFPAEPETAPEPEPSQRPNSKTQPSSKTLPSSKTQPSSKPGRSNHARSKPSLLSRALRSTGSQRSALSAELGATAAKKITTSKTGEAETPD